jgi:hypothetical protein
MSKVIIVTIIALTLSVATDAAFTVNVCFTVAGKGVSNALVKCYDSDWGPDDVVGPSGGVRTGTNGCVAVRDTQTWYERPDVYCQIFANGECFAGATTRIVNDHSSSSNLNLGTLALTYDANYCGNFGADGNGCGPESFPSWLNDAATSVSGFADQCAAHDTCYSSCSVTRTQCDDEFLDDMEAVCAGSWTCLTLANLYYQAVDGFGASACIAARTGKCTSTALCNQ